MPTKPQKLIRTDDPLLTVQEVALLDHCSEKTVRRAIAAGQLRALRVGPGGHLIRIDPADHAAYRNACPV
jgi:excisionase family DNA binding protein